MIHVKMQKNKVISSHNKCSTENAPSWCPSYFVTAAQCCQTSFPLQNSEQRFEDHPELSWLEHRCALSCMKKSPDLNH